MDALRTYLVDALMRRDYAAAAAAMWVPGTPLLGTATSSAAAISSAGTAAIGSADAPRTPPAKPGSIESPEGLVDAHLCALASAVRAQREGEPTAHWLDAARRAGEVLQGVLRAPRELDRSAAPLLVRACANALYLARNSRDEAAVQDAARLTARAFSLAATDRGSDPAASRRWATYGLAALLFRTYFALGTVRLCEPIVRAVRSAGDDSSAFGRSALPADVPDAGIGPGMPPLEAVPRAQAAAYEYYCAALALHGSRLPLAEAHAVRALWLLRGCPSGAAGAPAPQVMRVLLLLAVARMARGVLPRRAALQAWGLEGRLGGLAAALRSGDPRLFEDSIAAQRAFLAGRGLLLAVQLHLRHQLMLSFVRRAHGAALRCGLAQEGRLPVAVLLAAGRAAEMAGFDADAAECLVAGLVHARLLRGYISHAKQVVVLSRRSPFVRAAA